MEIIEKKKFVKLEKYILALQCIVSQTRAESLINF